MEIEVSCHAGYKADEFPTRFRIEGRSIEVVRVVDQWRMPERHCFRVLGQDRRTYLLEREIATNRWFCPEISGLRGGAA